MKNTIALAVLLWLSTLTILLGLYFVCAIIMASLNNPESAMTIYLVVIFFTIPASVPSLIGVALLLPLLRRKVPVPVHSILVRALVLVTVVCGIPATCIGIVIVETHGPYTWLMIPAAALVGSWIAVVIKRDQIAGYANPASILTELHNQPGNA